MKKLMGMAASVLAACVLMLVNPVQAADEKPANDIKGVMAKAHKSKDKETPNLLTKATGKDATADDKKALLALYTDLSKNDPPKGDKEEWKKKTTAIVAATKDLADGKEGAAAKVKAATNCKGCHDAFKG